LTPPQIATAKKVYATYTINGAYVLSGLNLGSEDQWAVVLGGSEPSPLGQDYIKYLLLDDPTWPYQSYDDSIVGLADAENPGGCSADQYNMTATKARGAKIIMYHGMADGLIPTGSSSYFYEQVAAAVPGGMASLREWFRFFLVPGMGHCSSTSFGAPWYFAGGGQAPSLGTGVFSTPGFSDAKHDALLALMEWVEKGVAVESIVATTWNQATNSSSGVLRQRPLCPFPETAKLLTGKEEKMAINWACS
jgi:hypothetical protein